MSPFASSIRQQVVPTQGFLSSGIGSLKNLLERRTRDVPQENVYGNMVGSLSQGTPDPMPMRPQISMTQGPPDPMMPTNLSRGPENFYAVNRPQQLRPANPFADNEQYQALMEYQKSMAPSQEQQDRLSELRTAFEGTGGYKDYRIQQMEQQLQQRQPRMGMGLGGMRPTGMGMFGGFPQQLQRNPYQQMPVPRGGYNQYNRGPMQQPNFMQQPNPNNYGGYGMQQAPQQQYQMPQPQYQPYQNPYQQAQPQPQQFGGYGMGQSMGGYGGYGGMSNPYQPQQFGQQSMSQPQQFGRMY